MNGEAHLSGERFDIMLVDFILTEFNKEPGIDLSGIVRPSNVSAKPPRKPRLSSRQQHKRRLASPSSLLTPKRLNSTPTVMIRTVEKANVPFSPALHGLGTGSLFLISPPANFVSESSHHDPR